MARIVITTWGSAGDINPYIALAHGLKARGHAVTFAVESVFGAIAAAEGFAMQQLSGNAEQILLPYAREMFNSPTPLTSIRILYTQYVLPTLRPRIGELRDACRDADLLVSSGPQLAASFAAELSGTPWASVVLTPANVPSAHLATIPLPSLIPAPVAQTANQLLWSGASAWLRRLVDDPVNALRHEYGLPLRRDWGTVGGLSHSFTAVASSPAFAPPPPDWPAWVHETGFLFHDGAATWEEPEAVTTFLAGGRPVVAVSSGSMGPYVPRSFDRFFRTALAAVWRSGARALVIGAASGSLPETLPPWAMAIPFAPFSRVYPRCAVVMHHGGIGTTAQGLRAGVPAFVLPWGADQAYTALQMERIGAGRWLSRGRFTAERGGRVLHTLLHEPRYRDRARAIAVTIAGEDGVKTLCDALEAQLAAPLAA